jgi:hypothetical protein
LELSEGALCCGLGILVAGDIDIDNGTGGDVGWEQDGGEFDL